jgi:hypothetical protein
VGCPPAVGHTKLELSLRAGEAISRGKKIASAEEHRIAMTIYQKGGYYGPS